MKYHDILRGFILLAFIGLVSSACEKLGEELDEDWLQKVEITQDFKVKQIYSLGNGVENNYQGYTGQGVAVRDKVMYRLYNHGLCQTYDVSDLANPSKIASFELGSHQASNHSNCAQFYADENGDALLYVSGLKGGKTYVERVTPSGSTLIQTITLSKTAVLNQTVALNAVCGDDGNLWYFGSGGNKLLFAKARRPLISEGDVILGENDILDYWIEDGFVYDDDVWQGGKVYGNLLFFLFGATGSKAHLAVYDTRAHERILDIDLSDVIHKEPEDCELIPEGILIVTNGGSNYYLVKPK